MIDQIGMIYAFGWILLLASAPALAVAIATVAREKPRGCRIAITMMLISWLTCPIWFGFFVGVGLAMATHAGFVPMSVLGILPAIAVLLLAWRGLNRWLAGIIIGLASYVSPIIGVALHEIAGGIIAVVTSALVWHLWVIASILLDPLRQLKHVSGQCNSCGYDLTGIETDRCPECGEPCVPQPLASQ